ncbi:MAG: hypothetical protein ACLP7F_13840 [Acidimicrobiales bacterium]
MGAVRQAHEGPGGGRLEPARSLAGLPISAHASFGRGLDIPSHPVIADALYVVLAPRLNADLITGDLRLANAPNLPPGLNVVTLPSVV